MAQIQDERKDSNYELFRDSLSSVLIERITQSSRPPKTRKRSAKHPSKSKSRNIATSYETQSTHEEDDPQTAAEDLADFIDYIASEIFHSLPDELQTLDHRTWREQRSVNDKTLPPLQDQYTLPLTTCDIPDILTSLDPSIEDSLLTYGITAPDFTTTTTTTDLKTQLTHTSTSGPDLPALLAPVLTSYLTTGSTPPRPPSSTKAQATACEMCGRDWINLTYHHLIPRMVHAKVVKRGWHRADELQNVAWICGACHRFVHQFADHETLARRYYTVGLLLAEPEVAAFARWVGRLRWKGLGAGTRRKRS